MVHLLPETVKNKNARRGRGTASGVEGAGTGILQNGSGFDLDGQGAVGRVATVGLASGGAEDVTLVGLGIEVDFASADRVLSGIARDHKGAEQSGVGPVGFAGTINGIRHIFAVGTSGQRVAQHHCEVSGKGRLRWLRQGDHSGIRGVGRVGECYGFSKGGVVHETKQGQVVEVTGLRSLGFDGVSVADGSGVNNRDAFPVHRTGGAHGGGVVGGITASTQE